MRTIEDGLEVQVAAGGPARGANGGNDLAGPYAVPGLNSDSLEVVVGSDQAVAVVELNTVAAAPRVPTGRPNNAGIGREYPGATGCREVLAGVELIMFPGDRAGAQAKGRAWCQELQGRDEHALAGPRHGAESLSRELLSVSRGTCGRIRAWNSAAGHQRIGGAEGRGGFGAEGGGGARGHELLLTDEPGGRYVSVEEVAGSVSKHSASSAGTRGQRGGSGIAERIDDSQSKTDAHARPDRTTTTSQNVVAGRWPDFSHW